MNTTAQPRSGTPTGGQVPRTTGSTATRRAQDTSNKRQPKPEVLESLRHLHEPQLQKPKRKKKRAHRGTGIAKSPQELENQVSQWKRLGCKRMLEYILAFDLAICVAAPLKELTVLRAKLRETDPAALEHLWRTVPHEEPSPFSIASEAEDPYAWICNVRVSVSTDGGRPTSLSSTGFAYSSKAGLEGCYMALLKDFLGCTSTGIDGVVRDFVQRANQIRRARQSALSHRARNPQPALSDLIPSPPFNVSGRTFLASIDYPTLPCAIQVDDGERRPLKRWALPKHSALVYADYDKRVFLMHCHDCGEPLCFPNQAFSVPVKCCLGSLERRLLCEDCVQQWYNKLALAPGDDVEPITNLVLTEFGDCPVLAPLRKPIVESS